MDRNEAQREESERLVAGPREQKYGHPKVNYKRIALIWSAVLGVEVTPVQAVLCELGVKFSRLVQSPDDHDTQVDIHGYLSVLQRLLDPEDQPTPSMETVTGAFNTFKPKPDPFSDWTEEEKKRGWKVRGNPTEPWAPEPYELKPENAPTITFTGEPQATMKEDEILWAKFGDGTAGPIKFYADGSKDMTFEEACGELARRNPCGQ